MVALGLDNLEAWLDVQIKPKPLNQVKISELLSAVQSRKLGLSHIRLQYKDFIKKRLEVRTRQFILTPLRAKMRGHNFSNKIIMNTEIADIRLVGNRKFRVVIRSEYIVDGFDVGLAREKGTRDHWIYPVFAKALHWQGRGRSASSGRFERQDRFSKGHKVSGMPRLMLIRKTLDEQSPKVVKEVKRDIKKWMQSILA